MTPNSPVPSRSRADRQEALNAMPHVEPPQPPIPDRDEEFPLPPIVPGYHILEWIGEGGMGEVWLARQLKLDRVVALKFLRLDPHSDPTEPIKRFRHEAELMGRLQHPNIVTVFASGDVEGRPYLEMEFVRGHDLRHEMEPGKPMGLDQIRGLIPPLIDALQYLHENNVQHRDLKPENILIGTNFSPKLTDFGIAIESMGTGFMTTTERWMGTIGYVSPEQQYRLKVDGRADQYSLAAVVYEMLTGQKALGVFKPPSEWNKALDGRVDEVIITALKEDRDDRYRTIREFGDRLLRALDPAPRPGLLTRRKATVLTLAALVPVGLVVAKGVRRFRANWKNSLEIQFQRIPRGDFLMGSPPNDPWSTPDELPAHKVTLGRGLSMGKYEVTVGQFHLFAEDSRGKYRTQAEASGLGGYVFNPSSKVLDRSPAYTWRTPNGRPAKLDDPVTQVTWHDAVKFCEWLTSRPEEQSQAGPRRTYRLPTEAEWEYACRAPLPERGSSEDEHPGLERMAVSQLTSAVGVQPVHGGSPDRHDPRAPNRWGLHDMLGNVWEWCLNAPYAYPSGSPVLPASTPERELRMLRGGAWDCEDLSRIRCAARLDSRADFACSTYGFRVLVHESP